ncbi:MAG: hypothetical protein J6O09_00670 [Lachnospiraceae bacterium]|nr:hypothetical protein [Lachnospiraceae bacterium]
MINYFIAYGYLFGSIFVFIELILFLKHFYPNKEGKKISTKTLVTTTISLLIIFIVLTVLIATNDYSVRGNLGFQDAGKRFFGALPGAIRTGIICASVIAGRYIYLKFIKRRKY